jgi:hypothetical protein
MTTKQIHVTVTPYEGTDFPEAVHYPEYVADQLSERYGARVEYSEGLRTAVHVYGFEDESETEREVRELLEVTLWEDFCADGYKGFLLAGTLRDYETGSAIRPATMEEQEQSRAQARRDGGAGVIEVDGRRCYVEE